MKLPELKQAFIANEVDTLVFFIENIRNNPFRIDQSIRKIQDSYKIDLVSTICSKHRETFYLTDFYGLVNNGSIKVRNYEETLANIRMID